MPARIGDKARAADGGRQIGREIASLTNGIPDIAGVLWMEVWVLGKCFNIEIQGPWHSHPIPERVQLASKARFYPCIGYHCEIHYKNTEFRAI